MAAFGNCGVPSRCSVILSYSVCSQMKEKMELWLRGSFFKLLLPDRLVLNFCHKANIKLISKSYCLEKC